jgi:hypothetical protein
MISSHQLPAAAAAAAAAAGVTTTPDKARSRPVVCNTSDHCCAAVDANPAGIIILPKQPTNADTSAAAAHLHSLNMPGLCWYQQGACHE